MPDKNVNVSGKKIKLKCVRLKGQTELCPAKRSKFRWGIIFFSVELAGNDIDLKSTGKQVFYEKTKAEMVSIVLSIGDSFPLF